MELPGFGQLAGNSNLREIIRSQRPSLIFLIETLVNDEKIEQLRIQLGFDGKFVVNRVGRGGGLALLWKQPMTCNLLCFQNNFIDVSVHVPNKVVWRLTCFYGFPERNRRKDAWNLLRTLHGNSSLPWCILGDFNDLLSPGDKMGSVEHPNWLFRGFLEAINDCELSELELMGHQFTWERGRGTTAWVQERLDRAFASVSWFEEFPLSRLTNLLASSSDHSPILLELDITHKPGYTHRFRFENLWVREQDFNENLKRWWQLSSDKDLLERLSLCSVSMAKWGREFWKRFRRRIKCCSEKLVRLRGKTDDLAVGEFFRARAEMDSLLDQEEVYWKQGAKDFWLNEGDSNTRYFHSHASSKQKHNQIRKLNDVDGNVVSDKEGLSNLAKTYFEGLFAACTEEVSYGELPIEHKISVEENNGLVAQFSLEEFTRAVMQMLPDKAPGPDGLNLGFYQHFWKLLGPVVFQTATGWLETLSFPRNLNDTLLCLIPKCTDPQSMNDLRPISLCNVIYKIIAKVLANRMKHLLSRIISSTQSAFAPGRSITDNVMIAYELLHYMKRKQRGNVGEVALKLDISKAYDRVDWKFLQHML